MATRRGLVSFFDWAQYPGVTISGGSFMTDFPATNMLLVQPQTVAWASSTSVTFTVNLGASRTIGLLHLQNLVTDPTGTIQVTCGTYDSGIVNSWATDGAGVYPQLLYTALGRPRVFVPAVPVVASSATFAINAASGNLMIGFVGVCEVWETPSNILAGDIITVHDESDLQTIPFGSTYITPRAVRRMIDFGIPPIPDHFITPAVDDFVRAFDLAMINGKSSPVMVVKYPDDTDNLERNSVWGTISNDQPFTHRFFGYHDTTFQIRQLV
jgi:hypothetical protein